MTSKLITSFAAAAVSLVLVACGGGGGSSISSAPSPDVPPVVSSFPMDGVSAIALTGALPPQETVADQQGEDGRAPGILERSNYLLLSSSYGESSDSEFPTFITETECSGTSCTYSGTSVSVNIVDHYGVTPGARAILTKHGITTLLLDDTWGEADDDTRRDDEVYGFRAYFAWMDHGAFSTVFSDDRYVDGDYAANTTSRWGVAHGELTGSRPTATATWQGLMVGTPQTGNNKFNFLQGDATLAFDMSTMTINVAFTDIKDLDLNVAHSTSSIRFDDIPVAFDGTFGINNSIQGGFHGPEHAETTGVFEQVGIQAGIVGSFGAKKQQ